jgi:hypothetical protein
MRTRAAMEKPAARATSRKAKVVEPEIEAPASILFASAMDDAQKSKAAGKAARQVPAPEGLERKLQAFVQQSGLLSKVISWFRTRAAAPSHLRLAETVSLGEKRFVAIIHVEGRKFLIGGGTAGVSLLTQLDETA